MHAFNPLNREYRARKRREKRARKRKRGEKNKRKEEEGEEEMGIVSPRKAIEI